MRIMSKDVDEAKRACRFSRGWLQWLIGTYTYMCAYTDCVYDQGRRKPGTRRLSGRFAPLVPRENFTNESSVIGR